MRKQLDSDKIRAVSLAQDFSCRLLLLIGLVLDECSVPQDCRQEYELVRFRAVTDDFKILTGVLDLASTDGSKDCGCRLRIFLVTVRYHHVSGIARRMRFPKLSSCGRVCNDLPASPRQF